MRLQTIRQRGRPSQTPCVNIGSVNKMKFALVNGKKTEAAKGVKGSCPSCGSELVAKCGELRVDHWAHKGNRDCDPWKENETEWHRSWKDKFPIEWQEVDHRDDSGEKHRADVKTASGWVLEFQHSYLKPAERRARNDFYRKLVWVVDGLRRPTDLPQFKKVLDESIAVDSNRVIRRVNFPEVCRLLKEWRDSNALVFFDFHEAKELNPSMLWFLFPTVSARVAYLSWLPRLDFIERHNRSEFEELVRSNILPIRDKLILREQNLATTVSNIHPNRLPGFERYLANRRRKRRF